MTDIFLSHDWGAGSKNHKRVVKLNDMLTDYVTTWIDAHHLEPRNMTTSMFAGIENSKKVVVFITQAYMIKASGEGLKGQNDNCYKEWEHILETHEVENIIPVVNETGALDHTQWNKAFQKVFNDVLYVDYSHVSKLESCVFEIYKRCRKPDLDKIRSRDRYEGELNGRGQMHGYGELKVRYTGEGGEIYKGNFENGLAHGLGKYKYKNDWEYTGEFKDGKRHGHGNLVMNNGSYYVGEFMNNDKEGSGKQYRQKDDIEYDGFFKKGMFHGHGKYESKQLGNFEGEFTRHKFHGAGKMIYADKSKFDGHWVEDKKSIGWFIDANGDSYIGDWKNNMKHGKGKIFFANGDKYEGDFSFNKMDGLGKTSFRNGNSYDGSFRDGKRNGLGRYYFADKCTKYEGAWEDNQRHGNGVQQYANGDRFEGIYCKGERKDGKFYFKESKVEYEGSIRDNFEDENGRKKDVLLKGTLNYERALKRKPKAKHRGMFGKSSFLSTPFLYGVDYNYETKKSLFTALKGLRLEMHWNNKSPTKNKPFLRQQSYQYTSIVAEYKTSASSLEEGALTNSIDEALPKMFSSPVAPTTSPNRLPTSKFHSPRSVSAIIPGSPLTKNPNLELSSPPSLSYL